LGSKFSFDDPKNFLVLLGKFFVCFSDKELFFNKDSFSDVFLPENFFEDIIKKLSDFYQSNKDRLDYISSFSINVLYYGKEIQLDFIVFLSEDKCYFVLNNDSIIRYEFFRTSILNTISHELKTPLTIIKGYLQYVIKILSREDKLLGIFSTMLNETYKLEEMIGELIEVSKFYSNSVIIKKDVFSLHSLIDMVVNKFRPKLKSKSINMILDIPQNDMSIVADFERIRYVLSELLENSIKYGRDQIILRFYYDGKGYYFEVLDNGIGMSKDVIDNIFYLFSRTNNELNRKIYGLGIGLFLVKKIVDAHNGEIKIESKINEGTKVSIFIPVII